MAEDGGVHQGPDHHDHDGEDLLVLGVGRHVAKADGGEGSAGEVQGSDVGVAVLHKKGQWVRLFRSPCFVKPS